MLHLKVSSETCYKTWKFLKLTQNITEKYTEKSGAKMVPRWNFSTFSRAIFLTKGAVIIYGWGVASFPKIARMKISPSPLNNMWLGRGPVGKEILFIFHSAPLGYQME